MPPAKCGGSSYLQLQITLPQHKITLNLIWQSNATPTVSAYAHLSGPFDYNKMLLTLMGCEAQIHKKTDKQGT
jgi:hypothetical protein